MVVRQADVPGLKLRDQEPPALVQRDRPDVALGIGPHARADHRAYEERVAVLRLAVRLGGKLFVLRLGECQRGRLARVVPRLVIPPLGQRGQREAVLRLLRARADAVGLLGHRAQQFAARAVRLRGVFGDLGEPLALVEVGLGAGVPEHAVEPFADRRLQRRERVGFERGRQHLGHAA